MDSLSLFNELIRVECKMYNHHFIFINTVFRHYEISSDECIMEPVNNFILKLVKDFEIPLNIVDIIQL